MTLDNRDKADIPLGPAESLLLEAVETRSDYHGSSADEVSGALLEEARTKLPDAERGTGGELMQPRKASTYLYNTLDYPDLIAADASADRMHLAQTAGALALGVDMADTIKAENSAELMLAHELAAAHAGAMRLMGQVTNMTMMQATAIRTDDGANLRVTRLAGAASRLMLAFQQGLVTLDKLRAGGKQTILVQHVQVNEGGQAVVAGKVRGGKGGGCHEPISGSAPVARKNSGRRGEGSKMTDAPPVKPPAAAHAAPRCGATRKYDGRTCQSPAMPNGRCRFHGGKSTGPRTPEGAERARQAALRHGFYTAEAKAERRSARSALVGLRAALASVDGDVAD